MAKKKAVPNRMQAKVKRENKFIDMPKEQLIKILVIIGIVIVAIVLFFVLRRAFDGHLPVKDGVVVTEADNWIVYNAETSTSPRYFKLGAAGDVDGYTRSRSDSVADPNTANIVYTPDDEASPITRAEVVVGARAYNELAPAVMGNIPAYFPGAQVGQLDESDVGGKPARSFGYDYSFTNPTPSTDAQAQGAEGADPAQDSVTYTRGHYVYLQASGGRSLVVSVLSEAQDQNALATPEQLKADADKIAAALTID